MSFIGTTDQATEQGFGGIVSRWRFVWSVRNRFIGTLRMPFESFIHNIRIRPDALSSTLDLTTLPPYGS